MEARCAMQPVDAALEPSAAFRCAMRRIVRDQKLDGGLAGRAMRRARPRTGWSAAQLYRIDLGPTFISLRAARRHRVRNRAVELPRHHRRTALPGARRRSDATGRSTWRCRARDRARAPDAAFGGPRSAHAHGEIRREIRAELIFGRGLDVGVFDGESTSSELVLDVLRRRATMQPASRCATWTKPSPDGECGFGDQRSAGG